MEDDTRTRTKTDPKTWPYLKGSDIKTDPKKADHIKGRAGPGILKKADQ